MQLKNEFYCLLEFYTNETGHIEKLWRELETLYSSKGRYYHNLEHLEFLLKELQSFKTHIQDLNAVLFAIFYHDAIYDPLRRDNEEKSAELAAQRLSIAGAPKSVIANCCEHILATKHHAISADADTNIFTDADLSILGAAWQDYELYSKKIRLEYSIYSDEEYHHGRKNVLKHFLAMDRIFKTKEFYNVYELQARGNLMRELEMLQK